MARVTLILPWSGARPGYWRERMESAARVTNNTVEFRVATVERSLGDFKALVERRLGTEVNLTRAYKLCDLKPMYGALFPDEIAGSDYWAFGDCDVVYGPGFAGWLARVTALGCDVATVQTEYCAGPLTLVRNCAKMNRFFERAAGWREMLRDHHMCTFDELGFNWFRRWLYGGESWDELRARGDSWSAAVWRAAGEGEIRLVAEEVIDESATRPDWAGGERAANVNRPAVMWHRINEKNRGLRRLLGRLARGDRASWLRLGEFVARNLRLPGWWRKTPWNNR